MQSRKITRNTNISGNILFKLVCVFVSVFKVRGIFFINLVVLQLMYFFVCFIYIYIVFIYFICLEEVKCCAMFTFRM